METKHGSGGSVKKTGGEPYKQIYGEKKEGEVRWNKRLNAGEPKKTKQCKFSKGVGEEAIGNADRQEVD